MERIMRFIMSLLAGLCGLYSLLIFIRILLSWFSRGNFGQAADLLNRITEPYLSWWRRIPGLMIGFMDLSPIAALAALSIVQTIFSTLAHYGTISIGIIIAVILRAVWSAVSFLLGFCIIILILRFFAHMTNRDTHTGFWMIIDTVSRPILNRVKKIIFSRREVNYLTCLVVSAVMLTLVWIGGKILIRIIITLIAKTPA